MGAEKDPKSKAARPAVTSGPRDSFVKQKPKQAVKNKRPNDVPQIKKSACSSPVGPKAQRHGPSNVPFSRNAVEVKWTFVDTDRFFVFVISRYSNI